MFLTKTSNEEAERIKSGNIGTLKKVLEREEHALIERLLKEKDGVHFIQGAASFCSKLRTMIDTSLITYKD